MVESFRFLGTTINRIEMGRQYDINRQERPTAHVLPSPTEEVWSQQDDLHTVVSGSYWECADILNQYLVRQCQCSWPKTTCQGCIKTHGLCTAITGVRLHHTYPAQSKMYHLLQRFPPGRRFRTSKTRTSRFKTVSTPKQSGLFYQYPQLPYNDNLTYPVQAWPFGSF